MGEQGTGIGLDLREADGAERTSSFRSLTPCPLARIVAICSGDFGPCASCACGVGHSLEGEGESPVAAEQVEEGVGLRPMRSM